MTWVDESPRVTVTVADALRVEDAALVTDGVRGALRNNDALAERLHVVACVSNPCGWRRRFDLARAFLRRMEAEDAVEVYFIELAYGQDEFHVAEDDNPRHLRLRSAGAPIWHKENLINVAVRALLPADWQAMAWIDADVAFDNHSWATDALRLLNGQFDVLQLFSHAEDLGPDGAPMKTYTSFGRDVERVGLGGISATEIKKQKASAQRWHSGYAWACTRRAFERCGGLYDEGILGSGDHYMSMALLGLADAAMPANVTADYRQSLRVWERRARGLRVGYVPGVLQHFYHGQKKNRGYHNRFLLLVRHCFEPSRHLSRRPDDGLLEPSAECPQELLEDIDAYFKSRDEDDIYRV